MKKNQLFPDGCQHEEYVHLSTAQLAAIGDFIQSLATQNPELKIELDKCGQLLQQHARNYRDLFSYLMDSHKQSVVH